MKKPRRFFGALAFEILRNSAAQINGAFVPVDVDAQRQPDPQKIHHQRGAARAEEGQGDADNGEQG